MEFEGNQLTQNSSASISSTSLEIMPACRGDLVRTMFIVTNTSAVAVATVTKGNTVAVADQGIRLAPGGTYIESNDGGFTCWQGSIQCVSDLAGTLAIVQTFVDRRY
jgi:hypothetical protein